MPKHNHAQTEQTTQDQTSNPCVAPWAGFVEQPQQQPETVNTEPLIGSPSGWAIPVGATSARIDAHRIGDAIETNYGLQGVLHVLEAHRSAVSFGDQPLLSENVQAALFNAALSLTARLEYMLEDWADKTDPNNQPAKG